MSQMNLIIKIYSPNGAVSKKFWFDQATFSVVDSYNTPFLAAKPQKGSRWNFCQL